MNPFRSLFVKLANMPPLLMLFLILELAMLITKITTGSLNVQTSQAFSQVSNLPIFSTELLVLIVFVTVFLTELLKRLLEDSWRKRNPIQNKEHEYNRVLGSEIKMTYPVLATDAWSRLKAALQEEVIKLPDVRHCHWQLISSDASKKEIQLGLTYVAEPLGRKHAQIYPRQLFCSLKVSSRGTKCDLILKFTAASPMDYRNVFTCIEQTKSMMAALIMSDPERAKAS